MSKNKNFLVVHLCDNDFSYSIERGLAEAVSEYGFSHTTSEEDWKSFLIGYVVGHSATRQCSYLNRKIDWKSLQQTEDYLQARMKVYYTETAPQLDHDHGSAYLNMHLQTIVVF